MREMAQRPRGPHWRDLTTDEQKKFVQLFTELLERNDIDRIKAYTDEKIIFTGERRDEDTPRLKVALSNVRDRNSPSIIGLSSWMTSGQSMMLRLKT